MRITSKHNPSDILWFMHDNKAIQGYVDSIRIEIFQKGRDHKNYHNQVKIYYKFLEEIPLIEESKLFKSKKELLASL